MQMLFDIRPLNHEDYEAILLKWWNDWGWSPPKREFLPQDGTGGYIVYDGDTPVCAGFIYKTNSSVAWVDWVVSNKEYRKKPHRKQAIVFLVEQLTNVCRNIGAEWSYALIKHPLLINTYMELGYEKGDSYAHEMIKKL